VPLFKPSGGTRPIAIPSVILRMAAGAEGIFLADKVREACEPEQHGVGTSGGAGLLHHAVVAQSAHKAEWGVLSLGEESAFGSLAGAAAASAATQLIPAYGPFVTRLLKASGEHLYVDSKGGSIG